MRLIDADEIPYCEYDLDNYHSFRAVEDEVIDEMPTIDAVIMPHAAWEEQNDGTHFCSCCGYDAPYTYDGNEFTPMFCYHCGALMDLKAEGKDE